MSRGISALQGVICRALAVAEPRGLTVIELVAEASRAGAWPRDPDNLEPEIYDLRRHTVRRACWSLRERGLAHQVERSGAVVWRAGATSIAKLIGDIEHAEREFKSAERELEAVNANASAQSGGL